MSVKWPREKDLQELLHKAGKKASRGLLEEVADMVLEDSKEVGSAIGSAVPIGMLPDCTFSRPGI